jgi:hypothetical protein
MVVNLEVVGFLFLYVDHLVLLLFWDGYGHSFLFLGFLGCLAKAG